MTVSPMERAAAMTEAIVNMNKYITLGAYWADMGKPSAVLRTAREQVWDPADLRWCQYCDEVRGEGCMRFDEDSRYICSVCLPGDFGNPDKLQYRGVMRT